MRVADYIAKYLANLGVNDVFLVSGGGIMHLLDGLQCNENINYICSHNEAAAAIEAEGYSRITGNLGVVFVTTGPGATNAITGAVDAWIDSVPMLIISGQTKRSQNVYNFGIDGLRQIGGQEVNILPIVESCTKYSAMVNEPTKIKYHLEKAVHLAKTGRSGPSWLDIPLDVQAAEIEEESLENYRPDSKEIKDSDLKIKDVFDFLKKSTRPLIISGHGIRLSGGESIFNELVEITRIPVVASKLGHDLLPYNSDYFIGLGGTRGTRPANFAIQNSDLILSLGSRLANPFIGYDFETFAPNAKKIIVEIDPSELQRFQQVADIKVNCDVKDFMEALSKELAHTNVPDFSNWVSKCQSWKNKYHVMNEKRNKDSTCISLYDFFNTVSDSVNDDSIIIADAGSVYYLISQVVRARRNQRIVSPAGLGSMGLSLPLGIGAYYASKNSEIVAITGEGSLQMNIQELQTIVHNNIPLKLFVVNNGGYLSIKHTQKRNFCNRFIGCSQKSGVSFPELSKIAYAYGIKYLHIKNPEDVNSIVENALSYNGPIICEVFTNPNEEIIPTVKSKILDNGDIISESLEKMYPLLPEKELAEIMRKSEEI